MGSLTSRSCGIDSGTDLLHLGSCKKPSCHERLAAAVDVGRQSREDDAVSLAVPWAVALGVTSLEPSVAVGLG